MAEIAVVAGPSSTGSHGSARAVASAEGARTRARRSDKRVKGQWRQEGISASASSMVSSAGAARSSAGIHSGKAASIVRWTPDAVCTPSTAARRPAGNRSATRTRAGQTRRWIKVTFPSTRRVATTSPESRTRVSTAKILAGRVPPPAPADRLPGDPLGQVRERSPSGLQHHSLRAHPIQPIHEPPIQTRDIGISRRRHQHSRLAGVASGLRIRP